METVCHRPVLLPHRSFTPPRVLSSSHVTCHVSIRNSKGQSRGSCFSSPVTNNSSKRRGISCCSSSGSVREVNESEFSEVVLGSDRPVLVEFVANWCGPCRLISPAVHSLAQEYKEKLTIVKIDHDSNPGLIEQFKVYGLPTLILFKNGKVVPESRREGAITKVKLKQYVDALLDSISVS